MKVIVLTHRDTSRTSSPKHPVGDDLLHGSIPSYCSGCGQKLSLLASIHEDKGKEEEPPPVVEPIHPDDSITVLPIDSASLELLVLVDKDLFAGKAESRILPTALGTNAPTNAPTNAYPAHTNGKGGSVSRIPLEVAEAAR